MQKLTTDVLIVGAGPAGLAAAIGLAQGGVDAVIVDAQAEAQNTSRAAVIHAGTLATLDRLGVAGRLITQGLKTPTFRIRQRDAVLLNIDFSHLPTPHPFALMIPQDETEAILLDRLRQLGGDVRRPVTLTGFACGPAGVTADCEGPDGPLRIAARFVVGADGGDSTVRRLAGIGFPGGTYGSFMLADVRMDWPVPREEVSLFFSPRGTLVVAPMSDGRARVVAELPDAPAEPTPADVERLLDERGPSRGARVHEVLWGSRFRVHHKRADRFRDGPVLLVGDAAHVHSPAGGQGMNLGLRDAEALSRALGDALSGDDAALTAWAAERRKQAAGVLRMTDRLTRLATLSNPAAQWLRNRLIAEAGRLPFVRRRVAETLARTRT